MSEENTLPSAQEIADMQAALDRQRAQLSISKIDEAIAALEAHDVNSLVDLLSATVSSMPDGVAKSHLGGAVSTLSSLAMMLDHERARNSRVLNPVEMPMVDMVLPPVPTVA
jgi:hypothetical protein